MVTHAISIGHNLSRSIVGGFAVDHGVAVYRGRAEFCAFVQSRSLIDFRPVILLEFVTSPCRLGTG